MSMRSYAPGTAAVAVQSTEVWPLEVKMLRTFVEDIGGVGGAAAEAPVGRLESRNG
jgi:hypothetical protein